MLWLTLLPTTVTWGQTVSRSGSSLHQFTRMLDEIEQSVEHGSGKRDGIGRSPAATRPGERCPGGSLRRRISGRDGALRFSQDFTTPGIELAVSMCHGRTRRPEAKKIIFHLSGRRGRNHGLEVRDGAVDRGAISFLSPSLSPIFI